MSGLGRTPLSPLLDLAWRTAFRLGFPLARIWWRLARPRHEGVVVAIYVGPALLLVRSSYRAGWHLPGGGGLAANSRADVYVGEVSWTAWLQIYPGRPHPPNLRSLQKFEKVE